MKQTKKTNMQMMCEKWLIIIIIINRLIVKNQLIRLICKTVVVDEMEWMQKCYSFTVEIIEIHFHLVFSKWMNEWGIHRICLFVCLSLCNFSVISTFFFKKNYIQSTCFRLLLFWYFFSSLFCFVVIRWWWYTTTTTMMMSSYRDFISEILFLS